MLRLMRSVAAILLSVSIGALPLVLDHCVAACAAHAAALAAAPPCHHATATGARIDSLPAACGHDHSGTAVSSAVADSAASRVAAPDVAVATVLTMSARAIGVFDTPS